MIVFFFFFYSPRLQLPLPQPASPPTTPPPAALSVLSLLLSRPLIEISLASPRLLGRRTRIGSVQFGWILPRDGSSGPGTSSGRPQLTSSEVRTPSLLRLREQTPFRASGRASDKREWPREPPFSTRKETSWSSPDDASPGETTRAPWQRRPRSTPPSSAPSARSRAAEHRRRLGARQRRRRGGRTGRRRSGSSAARVPGRPWAARRHSSCAAAARACRGLR
mmetsp:Transcript_12621/g.40042  ORF Transcript_12621/g.40042 Transcript_12621/m.40042 type:complete len:222 (-) Transcript_12621:310-975(-)